MGQSTRWFDENGKEIIREPVNPDELEHVAEVGGELEESSVGINFYSEHLNNGGWLPIPGPCKSSLIGSIRS